MSNVEPSAKESLITRYLSQAKEKNLLYTDKSLQEWLQELETVNTYQINEAFQTFFRENKLITIDAIKRTLNIREYKPVNQSASCHRTIDELKNAPNGISFKEYLANLAEEEPSENPKTPAQRTPAQFRNALQNVVKLIDLGIIPPAELPIKTTFKIKVSKTK